MEVINQQQSQARPPLSIEQYLGNEMFARNYERTSVDKPLAKEDVQRVKELMKKQHLSKEELTEVYHHVSTTEIKLLNFGVNDKYQLTECIITMDSIFNAAMQIYDIYETLPQTPSSDIEKQTKELWMQNRTLGERCVRTLLTHYLYMSRGTLSLDGVGFDKVITSRHEIVYPVPGAQESPRPGFFDFLRGGRN